MFNASQQDLQRRNSEQRAQRRQHQQLNTAMHHSMQHQPPYSPAHSPDTPMSGAAGTIDDIVRDHHAELHRRRSMPPRNQQQQLHQQQQQPQSMYPAADRRVSMIEFGNNDNQLRDYSFGVMTNSPTDPIGGGFSNISPAITMPGTSGSFSPPTMMSDDFSGLSDNMAGMAFNGMSMGQMADPSVNMFGAPSSLSTEMGNPMDVTGDFGLESSSNATGMATMGDMTNQPPQYSNPQGNSLNLDTTGPPTMSSQSETPHQSMSSGTPSYQSSSLAATSRTTPDSNVAQQTPTSLTTTTMAPGGTMLGPAPPTDQKSIYSKSGFDMLRALWQVATRKNAQVNLGAVDMSCAFVVCDVTLNDCPIIYVSDNFQNLTGYNQHEILGQNCRFLQAPDGQVEAGTKREFVDNGAVFNLKKKIAEGAEVQQSLINYRKGGKPFLNLLTMIPIPWDTPDIRYIIGFQIDLVECPDAIGSGKGQNGMEVNYKHSDIGQYIWSPPGPSQWEPSDGQTLGVDDVSTLLQRYNLRGSSSDWHRQSWDKMLLENTDDVVHVLSLKGLFLYLSPSCKRVLEYDPTDLVGNSISSICHPSDIVPVTRELKDATSGNSANILFRIRRKQSGYTWFESHGSLFVEQGKGRKCIILVGRKRPVFALNRKSLEANGGIGDSELWTKLSTSGMFLFVSANVRSLLDLQPDKMVGTSIQDLMRKESKPEFGRTIEKARRGRIVSCKHEVQNRRGQVLQAHTTLYPGDASEGQKPSFLLAQTKLVKASSRSLAPATPSLSHQSTKTSIGPSPGLNMMQNSGVATENNPGLVSAPGGNLAPGSQEDVLESEHNIFDELKTTRCTSWQYELRQMEKINRMLAEELHGLLSNKKRRKRRKGVGNVIRDCANCHTRNTPEWRRGPSGQRDLCNSCGLRWAKQTGRVSPRNSSRGGENSSKKSASPVHSSPLHRELSTGDGSDKRSDGDTTATNRSGSNSMPASAGTPSTAPSNNPASSKAVSMPPPSQPQHNLDGTQRASGMTAIQEEREVSM